MPSISLCQGKFQIDESQVVDPRADQTLNGIPVDQLADAVRSSFEQPIDFPPIAQAVMAEDVVAIAVEPSTPCGLTVARQVADWFVAAGNDRSRITILCADKHADKDSDFVIHDATDAEQMAMLVVDAKGNPLHVNRILFDADLVVPIGTGDNRSLQNSICPAFCGLETKKQIERLRPSDAAGVARMINSNLGVFWQVRIVTMPGEQVVNVMTGSSESVLERSAQAGGQVWELQIDRPAGMVLATIEAATSQSWANLRSAILTADKASAADAPLVMCTDLSGKPSVIWPTPDNQSKRQDSELAEVFQRRHVFLASRLTQDTTEQFGFGYLENSEQIKKLIDQHESCLLLRDAHRVGLQTREAV